MAGFFSWFFLQLGKSGELSKTEKAAKQIPSAIVPPSSGSFRAKWSRDVSLLFNYNFNYSTRPRVSLETILLDFFKTLTVKTDL